MTKYRKPKSTTKAGLAAMAFAACVGAAGFASQAEASSAPALGKYCKTYHPGSFANYFRSNGRPICTYRTRGSMKHVGVNISTACRLAGGNGRYRNYGYGRYQCFKNRVRRPAPRVVAPNVARFCQQNYRGSFVNYMRSNGAPVCTVKSHYSMMHYMVDLSAACRMAGGNGRYTRVAYRRYQCRV